MIYQFDETDRSILHALQRDATLSVRALAEQLGQAQSTIWRRLAALEKAELIRKRVALLDPAKLGIGVCVFVQINLRGHSADIRKAFEALVARTPEIMDCFAVTGSFDYTLIVRTGSVEDFEALLMHRILDHDSVANAASHFSLRHVKHETALPL
ncbi:Lrp/AsnC family transcriptional regulator [Pontivivens insulae]|uniref:DNA-binding transcriptional activator DecR n=1 Tax=Pontivivens insulae TaxID=1639689 RepID=A0A2R8AFU8_9RHOB|nr:Lrp/AsnC family transcriptional regulator [Pontivivens insulae]RED12299.1 AsnC family transcriptional regulator [Pontivivens insulae]SPF31056.1 DNA-binding transcriptional activator DecR [Pontivivens insulae]